MKRTHMIGAGILVVLALILITSVLLFRSQPTPAQLGMTSAADKLYEAGHYAEAAQLYEQLAAQGFEDAVLYYNLGNAHFQQGKMEKAWVAFEKAANLAPRDADIRANLAQAQQALGFPAEPARPGWSGRIAEFSSRWLTRNEIAVIALSFWLALGLLLLAWRGLSHETIHRFVRPAFAVALVLVILFGVALSASLLIDSAPAAMPIPSQLVDTSVTPGT